MKFYKFFLRFLTVSVICVLIAGAGFLFGTRSGAQFILKTVHGKLYPHAGFSYSSIEGDVWSGIILSDVKLDNFINVYRNSVFTAQKVTILFDPSSPFRAGIDVFNGRLDLLSGEYVLLNGQIIPSFDKTLSVYAPVLSIATIKTFFKSAVFLKPYSGKLSEVDLKIQRTGSSAVYEGKFHIKELARGDFHARDSDVVLTLTYKSVDPVELYGEVICTAGSIWGKHTAVIEAEYVKFMFGGQLESLRISAKGDTRVAGVSIDTMLTGPAVKPDIDISSRPILPKKALLAMLATGRRWKPLEETVSGVTHYTDAALDLIDYFVFGSKAKAFLGKLGITDFWIKKDKEKQQAGFTEQITDKADAGYSITQQQDNISKTPVNTHTYQGRILLTESIAVTGQRNVSVNQDSQPDEKAAIEDTIKLEYQKKF